MTRQITRSTDHGDHPIKCFYPNCVLENHLEGEHKFGRPVKPWGTLRQTQTFHPVLTSGGAVGCDACPRYLGQPMHRAVAFYVDMLGFGWALCAECAKKFCTQEPAQPAKEKPAIIPAPTPQCASVTSVVNPPAKVLQFARRNA